MIAPLVAVLLAAPPRVLAVLEFRNKLPGVESGYFADQVRAAALQAGPSISVMTPENMIVLLQSTGKDLASCEGECEVDTGRRIGADLVVSGELIKVGSNLKLTMRMYDTHDARLMTSVTVSGANVDELDRNLQGAIAKLLAPILTHEQPQAQPAPQPRFQPPPEAPRPTRFPVKIAIMQEGDKVRAMLVGPEGRQTCPNEITATAPCQLENVAPGAHKLAMTGDSDLTEAVDLPAAPARISVTDDHYGVVLKVGLPFFIGGAAALGGGLALGDTAGGAPLIAGIALGAVGILTGVIVMSVGLQYNHFIYVGEDKQQVAFRF